MGKVRRICRGSHQWTDSELIKREIILGGPDLLEGTLKRELFPLAPRCQRKRGI